MGLCELTPWCFVLIVSTDVKILTDAIAYVQMCMRFHTQRTHECMQAKIYSYTLGLH